MALIYTTNHAASSYGQPVLVDTETGIAYGPGDLLTTSQAAALLGVIPRTLRALAARHGVGRLLGPRVAVLTVTETESLRPYVRSGPGRPRKGDGAQP